MPKWTEYTSKDTLADNDEVMLYDATGKANKRGLMSKFWDYVVDKMSTAVISKLETENKTVIGALNYLNGKSNLLTYIGEGPDSGQNERTPSYDFTNEDTGFYLVLNTNNNAKEDYRFGAFCIVLHVKNHDSIAFSNCTASSTERVFSANGKILYGTSLSWQCRLMVYKINLTI